jgi:hypothetical protein
MSCDIATSQETDTSDFSKSEHIPELDWQYDALSLCSSLGFSETELAEALGYKDPDFIKNNRFHAKLQNQVKQLVRISWGVYYLVGRSKPKLHGWLRSPNKWLDGDSPKSYLLKGDFDKIEEIITLEAESRKLLR